MSIMLILSCYTGFFNVRRGWQSLNTGPRFYLRLIRRTGWLWIYTSRTTDGRPFKPKKLSVPFLYPGVPAGLTPFRGLVPLGRRNLVHNGQQKKNKKTNDDLQDITPKTKDSATWTPHINQGWFWEIGKDSTGFDINVVRLPSASENGTQLVRSGKWEWFWDMFNSWRAKWLILNYSVLEVTANFT